MNGKQRAVLWLGLILIAANLVRKWPEISAIIFTGAGTTSPPASGGNSSSGGNSIQVPIDPFLPTGPKITIPIPKL
jgi:hypothetical protein